MSQLLTFKQIKQLMNAKQFADEEKEFVTRVTVQLEITLYKECDEDKTPETLPVDTSVRFQRIEEDSEPGEYICYGDMKSSESEEPLTFDEIRESFRLDEDAPIWEYEDTNCTITPDIVKTFFAQ